MDGGEATAKSSSFLLDLGSAGEASVEEISMTSCSCTPCEAMLVLDAHTENCGHLVTEVVTHSHDSGSSQFGRPQLAPLDFGGPSPWLRILSGQRSVVCGSESVVFVSGKKIVPLFLEDVFWCSWLYCREG